VAQVKPCVFCDEPILPDEQVQPIWGGEAERRQVHRECLLRQVVGSVAHQMEECSCFEPGSTRGDPPGMTKREAARAAADLWQMTHQF